MFGQLETKFIAGNTVRSAVASAKRLNKKGIAASLSILSNTPRDNEAAESNAEAYAKLLGTIKSSGISASISVRPTQVGLGLNEVLYEKNLTAIAEAAAVRGNTVTLDMEEYKYKDQNIRIFGDVSKKYGSLQLTLQSHLHSTYHEAKMLLEKNASIRLVKGAYMENPSVAFGMKDDINRNYTEITKLLLNSGGQHAFATHDEKMIDFIKYVANTKEIPRNCFEFQLLYGVKSTLAENLAKEGYSVRVFMPYGKDWLPYMLRRIREAWQ